MTFCDCCWESGLRHSGATRSLGLGCRTRPSAAELSWEDWLGLLVDREADQPQNKGSARRLREAKLRQAAIVEDVNLHAPRGLDRAPFQKLTSCQWVRDHHHLVVIGPVGIGKSWLVCALDHKAVLRVSRWCTSASADCSAT